MAGHERSVSVYKFALMETKFENREPSSSSSSNEPIIGIYLMWNNPSAQSVNICPYDWFSKQADSLITEQNQVSQEGQKENDRMRRCGIMGVSRRCRENRRWMCHANKCTTMRQRVNKEYGLSENIRAS